MTSVHDPSRCDCRAPETPKQRCIPNIEAFCRAILERHLETGSRRADGTLTGPCTLNSHDQESLLNHLRLMAWQAIKNYEPGDDGRGLNRLAGYVMRICYWRIPDWYREEFGATRYLPFPIVKVEYEDGFIDATHHDDDLIGINPEGLSPRGQHAYRKVCLPLAQSGLEPGEFARRTKQSELWVHQALRIVRVELEAQGIRPSTQTDVPKVDTSQPLAHTA